MSRLWPGFSPTDHPVAVYDGERTWLYRHPSPPEEFHPDPRADDVFVFTGRHRAVVGSSMAEIGGVLTATLLRGGRDDREVHAEIAHETFHVFCHRRHPGWLVDESAALTYPVEDAEVLALRRLEAQALRQAVVCAATSLGDSAGTAAGWAATALSLRGRRRQILPDAVVRYERDLERCEGSAYYVEGRAAGSPRCLPTLAEPVGPDDLRRPAYATGEAIALLLDRFRPGWTTDLDADDTSYLDDLLRPAVADATPEEFTAEHRTAVADRAREDVAALREERRARRQGFLARDDRAVLTAIDDKPMRVAGFDPMNLQHLGGGDVLHTHYLKIAGEDFELELFDGQALTEAAGDHPLFDGIQRVTFTSGGGATAP